MVRPNYVQFCWGVDAIGAAAEARVRADLGEIKVIKDSYAGKTREGTVDLHLSKIPEGEVNLGPGTNVVLDKPATVSYQDGRPKTLYYVVDGKLRRAAFGVDD